MKCNKCGIENPVDARYCRQCGLIFNVQPRKKTTCKKVSRQTYFISSWISFILFKSPLCYAVALVIAVAIKDGQEGSFENFIIVAIITTVVGFILSRIGAWFNKD